MELGSISSHSAPLANVKLEKQRQDQEEKVADKLLESLDQASPMEMSKIRTAEKGNKIDTEA